MVEAVREPERQGSREERVPSAAVQPPEEGGRALHEVGKCQTPECKPVDREYEAGGGDLGDGFDELSVRGGGRVVAGPTTARGAASGRRHVVMAAAAAAAVIGGRDAVEVDEDHDGGEELEDAEDEGGGGGLVREDRVGGLQALAGAADNVPPAARRHRAEDMRRPTVCR